MNIGHLFGLISESKQKRSPWQRGKGRQKRSHLLLPFHRSKVSVHRLDDDRLAVKREAKITHFIERCGDGWRVRCAGRSGVSNFYASPKKAAEAYRLVVHDWGKAS